MARNNMWVARDKDGELRCYNNPPNKNEEEGFWVDSDLSGSVKIDPSSFPYVTWESEPLLIVVGFKDIDEG